MSKSNLTLFVGSMGGAGNTNGECGQARFTYPCGIMVDQEGYIYVTDTGETKPPYHGNCTIRKITPSGSVTTLAGTPGVYGCEDGVGANASFYHPSNGDVDNNGNVYVIDNYHAIRKITPDGVVTTLAGKADCYGSTDGIGSNARFDYPRGLAVDSAGNIYVADDGNSTIRKITADGVVSTLAGKVGVDGIQDGFGFEDGLGTEASFISLWDVAIDSMGNLFISDYEAIRKVTPDGLVTTFVQLASTFNCLDIDVDNNIYASDGSTTIWKITPSGQCSLVAGKEGSFDSLDGIGSEARFNTPYDIAVDRFSNIFIADSGNHVVRKIDAVGNVSTFAGCASSKQFGDIGNACSDSKENIFLLNNRCVKKITQDGIESYFPNEPWVSKGDYRIYSYEYEQLNSIVRDKNDNLYVTDSRPKPKPQSGGGYSMLPKFLRSSDPRFGVIFGISSIGCIKLIVGKSANLKYAYGVVFDKLDNIYVSDSEDHTIIKITPNKIKKHFTLRRKLLGSTRSVLCGKPGYAGKDDGFLSNARLNNPGGMVIDNDNNLYVADTGNHVIRKISKSGEVSTLAGLAKKNGIVDGVGEDARFESPRHITIDRRGNIYVVDRKNHVIRKVTSTGNVTTFSGKAGAIGFVTGKLPGVLSHPKGVLVHDDSLYIIMDQGIATINNIV